MIILLLMMAVLIKIILWGYTGTEEDWKQKKQKNLQTVAHWITWGRSMNKKKRIVAVCMIMLCITVFHCKWELYCLVEKVLHREVAYAIR